MNFHTNHYHIIERPLSAGERLTESDLAENFGCTEDEAAKMTNEEIRRQMTEKANKPPK